MKTILYSPLIIIAGLVFFIFYIIAFIVYGIGALLGLPFAKRAREQEKYEASVAPARRELEID